MSKLKSPLLSLDAHGTVGQAVTYQDGISGHIARSKPPAPGGLTLPRQYQRWLYQDYAYRWTQQTEATKATYRTDGVRYHQTAFQRWMSVMLTTLPDITAMYYLDTAGATLPDASRNANTLTRFGASLTDGLIDHALSFDGINNWLRANHSASLNFGTAPFSVELFLRLTTNQQSWAIGKKGSGIHFRGWALFYNYLAANRLDFLVADGAVPSATVNKTFFDTAWHYIYMERNGTNAILQVDSSVTSATHAKFASAMTNSDDLGIGFLTGWWYINATIDHVILRPRTLDATERATHALRRYAL